MHHARQPLHGTAPKVESRSRVETLTALQADGPRRAFHVFGGQGTQASSMAVKPASLNGLHLSDVNLEGLIHAQVHEDDNPDARVVNRH